jgi:hypothetical protein
MKKNIITAGIIAVIAIVAFLNVNVALKNEKSNDLSEISLSNVEALAASESTKSGVDRIVITQTGQSKSGCVNGYWTTTTPMKRTCEGKGDLPCTSGAYVLTQIGGRCAETQVLLVGLKKKLT